MNVYVATYPSLSGLRIIISMHLGVYMVYEDAIQALLNHIIYKTDYLRMWKLNEVIDKYRADFNLDGIVLLRCSMNRRENADSMIYRSKCSQC